jgi:hypothetical protein
VNPLWALQVVAVPDGTIIKHDDGTELTVTQSNAVTKGRTVHMTPENYEALKAKIPQR